MQLVVSRCSAYLQAQLSASPPIALVTSAHKSQLCLYSKFCSTDNSSLLLASCITGYEVTRAMSLANFAAADNAADDHCLT